MERRPRGEALAIQQRLNSGVFCAVKPRSMEQFERELEAFTVLFEGAPEAYLVTDQDGVILQANRQTCALFNTEAGLLPGTPLVSLIASEDRGTFLELLDVVSETVFRTELRLRSCHDHDLVWASLSAQRGGHGETNASVRWLLRNVTREKEEQARVEQQLRARIRELEAAKSPRSLPRRPELVEHQSHILAEVAHELRSPLGTIAGWIHTLGQSAVTDATLKRALSSMTRSACALARLIDDLLAHARAQTHQVVLKTSIFNLLRVVLEVMEDLRPLATLKQIRFEVSTKNHTIDIQGDAWRLQQAFRNVIGNAIKFTPEHGSVRLHFSIISHQVEVAVTDSGRGIPREELRNIFQPFVRLGAEGARHTGLGLGLSIAQRLVELHGGTIHAESEGLHCGATFRVRLPLFAPN